MQSIRGDERGQSEVLGAVLLLGIVVTASAVMAGMALGSFAVMEEQTAEETIERELLEVRSAATDVALEGEHARSLELDLPAEARVSTPEEPTTVEILHHDYLGNDTDVEPAVIYEETELGTLEVSHEDTRYALEGGGLFRLDGEDASMMSPPNLALHGYTANLPMLRLDADAIDPHSDRIAITPGEHVRPAFPNQTATYGETDRTLDNPVYNGSVEIVVSGDYYEGWAAFFDGYTDAALEVDHDNATVSVTVESIQELEFEQEITYVSDFSTTGAASVDGTSQSGMLPDSQPLFDAMLEQANTSYTEVCAGQSEGCTIDEADTYYHDGDLTIDDPLTIDTDDGDVELVIDGDLTVSEDINVTGDDEYGVEYYVNGTLDVTGDTTIGTDDEDTQAHRNTIIMTGDSMDPGQGNAVLDIVLYAPNADIDIAGTPDITGAIIGDSVDIRGDADISFDANLEELDGIDLSQTSTPIMYLHITENTAVVTG